MMPRVSELLAAARPSKTRSRIVAGTGRPGTTYSLTSDNATVTFPVVDATD
jgi:hypothetical protein